MGQNIEHPTSNPAMAGQASNLPRMAGHPMGMEEARKHANKAASALLTIELAEAIMDGDIPDGLPTEFDSLVVIVSNLDLVTPYSGEPPAQRILVIYQSCRALHARCNGAMNKTHYLVAAQHKAAVNMVHWGLQDTRTLWLAMVEETGEIAQAHLQERDEGGDASRVRNETLDLAALCVQMMARVFADRDAQIDAMHTVYPDAGEDYTKQAEG